MHASAALKTQRSQVKETIECIHILILLVYLIFNMGLEVEALLDDRLRVFVIPSWSFSLTSFILLATV